MVSYCNVIIPNIIENIVTTIWYGVKNGIVRRDSLFQISIIKRFKVRQKDTYTCISEDYIEANVRRCYI